MPCHTDNSAEDAHERAMLTKLVCRLDRERRIIPANSDERCWLENHRERDRLEAEQERANADTRRVASKALAKLTAKERAALGLNGASQ